MKENLTIAVASGKGGTGKTTIATNLSNALKDKLRVQLIDCDVEEPNSHLFINPSFDEQEDVKILVPEIDADKCKKCGICTEFCQFNAITRMGDQIMTFPELCHGCGGCTYLCPEDAIREVGKTIGRIEKGKANNIEFIHGKLEIGTPLAPPIIKRLKMDIDQDSLTIIDAPPGTSCPVVVTLYDVDFVLLVTEPTLYGLHDLELMVKVVEKLDIPYGVIINRADMGRDNVQQFCQENNIPIMMEVPFKREYAGYYAKGDLIGEHDLQFKEELGQIYQQIIRGLKR